MISVDPLSHAGEDDCVSDAITIRRLNQRAEFLAARNGRSERRKCLVVQAVRRAGPAEDHIGEGFTATKKVGNAIIRNRAKRRLREAARMLLPSHGVAGTDYVFIARTATPGCAWPRLLDEMKSALISLAPYLNEAVDTGDPAS